MADPAVVAFTGRSMGSRLQVHVAPPPAGPPAGWGDTLDALWTGVRAEFAATDLSLSKYRPTSELSRLNAVAGRVGEGFPAGRRLQTALTLGATAHAATDGRFDITVLATLDRLGEAAVATPPDVIEAGVSAAITTEPAVALVIAPPAPVDLGGIGKGLALRWACERIGRLLPAGAGALIDAGGDLAAVGDAPADGWRVGIEDPVAPGEHVAVAMVPTGAIATSSVRVRYWRDAAGLAQHHLVDPRTSQPARSELLAVTVADADPAWAEVWTKALFLAGRAGIGPEARERDIAAWWVDATGRVGMTPAAREMSVWVDEGRIG